MRTQNLRTIPMPLLAIIGPIIGLGYIIILPFTGLVALVSLIAYRTRQVLAMRRRTSRAILNIRW